jgi:hypothetical protein
MPIRTVALLVCLVALMLCSISLFASPTSVWLCCSDNNECPTGKCCDGEPLGLPSCGEEAVGYCMDRCVVRNENQ